MRLVIAVYLLLMGVFVHIALLNIVIHNPSYEEGFPLQNAFLGAGDEPPRLQLAKYDF